MDKKTRWTGAVILAAATTAMGLAAQPLPAGGSAVLMDVHGAGAQRSDPKTGEPALLPKGMGPQGDVQRIDNLVRLVRGASSPSLPYPIVDTNQTSFYDTRTALAAAPAAGSAFSGQDAQYAGLAPSYKDNGDGTVSDLNTGLMWQKNPGAKLTWAEAGEKAAGFTLAGHSDWRIPTIKELYSLIDFSGTDPDPQAASVSRLKPFIDTRYFDFTYGKPEDGDRVIDSQFLSATRYVSVTMDGNLTNFGVNFADGRIKGYPVGDIGPRGAKTFYLLLVRCNPSYGSNDLVDNGDGTVSDRATGLMWERGDSGKGMDWVEALAWVRRKNEEAYLGHSDWRLPNAKELQGIVDYGRSPATSGSAAASPLFHCTSIKDEGGNDNYGFYWTGTSHVSADGKARNAVYLAFGEALGFMPQAPRGKQGAAGAPPAGMAPGQGMKRP